MRTCRSHSASQPSVQGGYSIAEMLVVITIIGILSLVAVPQFVSMYRGSVAKGSLRDFTSMVRKARQLAVTRNERTRITFTTGGAGGTTFQVDEGGANIYSPTWVAFAKAHSLDKTSYFDSGSTVPTMSSKREIDFLPSGLVVSPWDSANPTATAVPLPVGQNSVVIRSWYKNMAYNQYSISVSSAGSLNVTQSKWQ